MTTLNYIIINSSGKKLSGFYPNDWRLTLAYRKGDYYAYTTEEEANRHLDAIQRYGIGRNLKVASLWE